jgi:sugar O-acyltransferase (sialic acid O-acetyltransferase NeuD family)
MKLKGNILLVGGGGHCSSIIDVIEQADQFSIAGIVEQQENIGKKILGYPVIGTDADLSSLVKEYKNLIITVGHIKSNETRVRLFNHIKTMGGIFPVVISPRAYVSKHAFVDEGTVVMHNAIVNASARIGKNTIVNTSAIIEHDTVVGDHCHVSTGVLINGSCRIGDHSFIGSNAMIKHSVIVEHHASIGAGSVVLNNIESYTLHAGNPAILKRRNNA